MFGPRRHLVISYRQRAALAHLVVEADKVVPTDSLIHSIWGETPPPTARGQVRACVSELRRSLNDLGVRTELIATERDGYRLRADQCSIDARMFEREVAEAMRFAHQEALDQALHRIASALEHWKVPAYPGVESAIVRAHAAKLERTLLNALEARTEWEMKLGLHQELVDELTEQAEQQPWHDNPRLRLLATLRRAGTRPETPRRT
ncbi:AfsR/SARP family transcriptional regulator [Streptoalloteichus hindustanus]|uniref:AfsR/SARP family transcriptional regulator n=1 Tax=Streptoalloteichus hindustanus TaxID=2017 RepID=UPI0013563584|nr:BTAD domain-containing putative transcriptional regulator [Streptoalloteichus hindustanus]